MVAGAGAGAEVSGTEGAGAAGDWAGGAGLVWAETDTTGSRTNEAAAKESQEGENTGFVFIILEIPNLLGPGKGDYPNPK
jgi:hypothetical protein